MPFFLANTKLPTSIPPDLWGHSETSTGVMLLCLTESAHSSSDFIPSQIASILLHICKFKYSQACGGYQDVSDMELNN